MMIRITSACDEGSDEPACTHDLARPGFRFSHKQSMQVEEDSAQFLDIESLWTRQNERFLEAFSDMR